ncbi:hypothetical protein IFM61606_05224 [Aspergillus udagawae]|uniref:Uncharacterized protein n=1 Tax=Aspergillus udagawae TaxID=91492 RepID=A0A8H3NLP4_9EURO|nr:uncharacterized protein Aud_001301 [Aspergillus udagawae]GFF36037.1 hypothetical protein IFM51744_02985 [Aspergillus udagawae]GFF96760.1 hypothetical protein IFM53868_08708 [Aspergillus udagawae]GFG14719.1 hypothetical protein IFM5058_07091 [Aspergillus udagawae]GFG25287.1 hypothetical protein IFM61606_05224 [Aspergillus udagawae]GIC85470.1 hypothetical protein Aud_001301 [Aspergillus udagawae]
MATTTQPSTADADEIMRLAVERFRIKMESSNRQFLQDRIEEIEAMNLPTEEEKLVKMRPYWPNLGIKGEDSWNDCAPIGPVRQSREERNVTRLADVKTVYHEYMDGIQPPRLLTEEWRQMYLDTVQSVCDEAAFRDEEDEDFSIPLCHELGSFIKYASGVQDPDFRRSGIAPFGPVFVSETQDYAFKDNPAVLALPPPNIFEARESLKYYLQEFLCDESFVAGTVDEDLEVRVGFLTGTGCRCGHDKWHSAYLYCRRFVEDSDPSHKDWAWRVVIFHADGENPTMLNGRKPRFDSIPEFLEWYSSWLEHSDLDQIRKDVMKPEYDSDEDYSPAWGFVYNG